MRIINPIDLMGSGIAESNATPEPYPEWSSGGPVYIGAFAEAGGVRIAASSDDASVVAYVSSYGGSDRIYVYDSATGETSDLTNEFSLHIKDFVSVAVSPDGGHVVASGRLAALPGPRVAIFSRAQGDIYGFSAGSFSFAIARNSSGLYFSPSEGSGSAQFEKILFSTRASSWSSTVSLRTNKSSIYHIGISSLEADLIFAENDYIDDIFMVRSVSVASGAVQASKALGVGLSESNFISLGESPTADVLVAARGRYSSDDFSVDVMDTATLAVQSSSSSFFGGLPSSSVRVEWSPDGSEFSPPIGSSPWVQRISYPALGSLTMPEIAGELSILCYLSGVLAGEASTTEGDTGNWFVDTTTNEQVAYTPRTYGESSIVIYARKVYQALSENNDRPDLGVLSDPPTWLDLGHINPLRMLDGKLDSVTTGSGSLNIEITPGMLSNGLALFNVTAATVQVTMTDPDAGRIYDTGEVVMKDSSGVLGWHDYFFSHRPAKKDLALVDLPIYPNAVIDISLSSEGSEVAIGEIVLGRVQTIAQTQYGTSVGIIDSSRKERDQFGNFSILERPFSKRAEYDLWLPRAATSGVQRILAGYRAKPTVYIGDIDEEATIVYGFYIDFQINYENFSYSSATVTVEGL